MLKHTIEKLEDVDEKYRDLYAKNESGTFTLETEGDPLKLKLGQFREENLKLIKDHEASVAAQQALQGKFDTLTTEIADLKKTKDKDKGVGDQAQAQIDTLSGQITEMKDMLTKSAEAKHASDKHLAAERIRGGLTSAIQKVATVRKGALEDALRRGQAVFSLSGDLRPVAKKPDGSVMLNDKGDGLSFDDYAKTLVIDAPFLFEGNKPGTALGSEGVHDGKVIPEGDLMKNIDKIIDGSVKIAPPE